MIKQTVRHNAVNSSMDRYRDCLNKPVPHTTIGSPYLLYPIANNLLYIVGMSESTMCIPAIYSFIYL